MTIKSLSRSLIIMLSFLSMSIYASASVTPGPSNAGGANSGPNAPTVNPSAAHNAEIDGQTTTQPHSTTTSTTTGMSATSGANATPADAARSTTGISAASGSATTAASTGQTTGTTNTSGAVSADDSTGKEVPFSTTGTMSTTGNTAAVQPGLSRGEMDTNTTSEIKTKLGANKETSALKIDVATMNGVVTLTGKANTQAEKEMIERLARENKGVVQVRNDIEVR